MADILLQNAITWLLANATSIGAILGWVTKPLRDKLSQLDDRLKAVESRLADTPGNLGERLRELDLGSTRAQEELDGLRRQLDDVLSQVREAQQDLSCCVSDEEFKAYVSLSSGKIEKMVETLGFIRGRMRPSTPVERG